MMGRMPQDEVTTPSGFGQSETDRGTFYDVARLKTVICVPEEFETELLRCSKHEIQRKYKSVCFIGATGSGKSQSCNTICGRDYFEASASMNSHTYETKGILAHWFGDPKNDKIFVLDTPGLGDSQGRDTKHIAEMVCAI